MYSYTNKHAYTHTHMYTQFIDTSVYKFIYHTSAHFYANDHTTKGSSRGICIFIYYVPISQKAFRAGNPLGVTPSSRKGTPL